MSKKRLNGVNQNHLLLLRLLQQEASSKLGFKARRTMSIAQKLYEGITLENETVGLITYMRTDSTRLSDTFVSAAQDYIGE